MSNYKQITLDSFFTSGNEMSHYQFAKAESSEKLSSLKAKLIKEEKVHWSLAFNKVEESIEGILNIEIPDILVMAWKKYSSLLKFTDKNKYPPEEINLVELAEHTIKSEHHPSIDVLFNGDLIDKIEFTITLTLILKGIILKIKNGKILEAFAGNCSAKGTLKCENIVLVEKKSETINFPASIDFGDGIPIAG